ncbi:MAG: hypothetical protein WC632_06720 [Candidatus Margulisiibacteriota bacterium]
MSSDVKVFFRPCSAGSLPARLGNLHLYPAQNGRVELAQVAPGRPKVLREAIDVRPPMEGIQALIVQRAVGVIVEGVALPATVTAPFKVAGDEYLDDLKKFAAAVVFLRSIIITGEGQEFRLPGFEPLMLNCDQSQINDFASQAEIRDPNHTILLNCFDSPDLPIPGDELYWDLSWLLGRLKINRQVEELGFTTAHFGQVARNCAAWMYQVDMTQKLMLNLMERDPSICETEPFKDQLQRLNFTNHLIEGATGQIKGAEIMFLQLTMNEVKESLWKNQQIIFPVLMAGRQTGGSN